MAAKKTFTFAIPDAMKVALTLIRERDGISEAEQIRRGIQLWIDSKAIKTARRRVTARRRA